MNTDLEIKGQETTVESTIKFPEKDIVTTTTKDYGFIISTQIIEKVNQGNTVEPSETVLKKI